MQVFIAVMTTIEIYQSNFIQSVTPPFNSGVQSLQLLFQILLNTKTNWNTLNKKDTEDVFKSLSKNAQEAYNKFSEAEKLAVRHKSTVDDKLESYVETEGRYRVELRELETKVKQHQTNIDAKNGQISEAISHVNTANDQLTAATNNMNAANEELHRRKRKKKKGLFGIPIIGDIAAAIAGLDRQIKHARRNAEQAQREVQTFQAVVNQRNAELRNLQSELKTAQSQKNTKEREFSDLKSKIKDLKDLQSDINGLRINLAKCVGFISGTFGKTAVLKSEAVNVVFTLEPLINTISDIGKHLGSTSGYLAFDKGTNLKLIGERFKLLSQNVQPRKLLDEL